MKLTKATVKNLELPPNRRDQTFYDGELRGFGLRIRAGGKRSWVAVYRLGTKVRRVTIGDAAAVSPEEARGKAREVLAKADLGEDTQARRVEERARLSPTLGSIVETYVVQHVETNLRDKPSGEVKRYLRSSWSNLHELPADAIERHDVASKLSQLVTTNGPVAANRARSALHAMFVWAMRQGLVSQNPVADTAKPTLERSRDRTLSDEELRKIWSTCRDDDHGRIVKLLLLTGQRRDEVAGMTWDELDFKKALWLLPAKRTKNHRPHDIPLSRQAASLLSEIEHRDGRVILFGRGARSFSGWSRCKRRLDERSGATGWRLHDLRRTVVTGMAELGMQPHVIEAVVNHISGHKAGVAGIYNRATYANEKRTALQAWADHLDDILEQQMPL